MFQYSMEILGGILEFDCLVCIADHCVTQEKLRGPWCPVIIGTVSTVMTKSKPGKSQKTMPYRGETLPMKIWFPSTAVSVKGLWMANTVTLNAVFLRSDRALKIVSCSIQKIQQKACYQILLLISLALFAPLLYLYEPLYL